MAKVLISIFLCFFILCISNRDELNESELVFKIEHLSSTDKTFNSSFGEPDYHSLSLYHDAVHAGETLQKIAQKFRLQLSQDFLHALEKNPSSEIASELKNLKPKTPYSIIACQHEGIKKIFFHEKDGQKVLDLNALKIHKIPHQHLPFTFEYKEIKLEQGLINDLSAHGLPDQLIWKLIEVLSFDVDFEREIRPGDLMTIFWKQFWHDEGAPSHQHLLKATLQTHYKKHQAYYFPTDNFNFVDHEGVVLKRSFLRSPLEYQRISSHFNLKRKHPVLHTIRAHKGVDYAAKIGTKIRTTADGVITFIGSKGGWGNCIEIAHGQKYSTVYAHMSRFQKNLKKGSRVKQGDLIGFVGMSGLATGPHLHYEFKIMGKHYDPLKVELPAVHKLEGEAKKRFKSTKNSFDEIEQIAKITSSAGNIE